MVIRHAVVDLTPLMKLDALAWAGPIDEVVRVDDNSHLRQDFHQLPPRTVALLDLLASTKLNKHPLRP